MTRNIDTYKAKKMLFPGIHKLPNKPVTMVIQHTVLLGLYGKLFHEYRFSSLVRFKTRVKRYVVLPLSQVY